MTTGNALRVKVEWPEKSMCVSPMACALPAECVLCDRWVCNACERVLGFDQGSDDDAPGLCDHCWAKHVLSWLPKKQRTGAR